MAEETKPFEVPSKHDIVYAFTISRVKEGSFKNLWQLKVTRPGEESIELVDADSLSTCLAKIGYVFEMDGL